MTQKLAIILLLWLFSGLAFSQSFTSINYTVSEGIPSNEVYEIFQDKSGFLWFGTDNGVVRFDGAEMKKFGTEQGLRDPVVFGFFEDYKNRIWFRTFSGNLAYYDHGVIHRYKYNEMLARETMSAIISSIYVDSADRVWFSCYRDNGLWGYVDANGNLEKNSGRSGEYEAYYVQKEGGELFGYNRVIDMKHMMINNTIVPVKITHSCGGVPRTIPVHWNNKLYFSICQEIFEFTDGGLKKVFTAQDPIISLSVDHEDNLWVGYSGAGPQKFSSDEFIPEPVPDFVKALSVTRVHSDPEGGLWFSTLESGVFYVPNIMIENHTTVKDEKIRHVTFDDDVVWFSTHTGTIYDVSHGQTREVKKFGKSLYAMFFDKSNRVWISFPGSTYGFNKDLSKMLFEKPFAIMKHSESKDGIIWTVNGAPAVNGVVNDKRAAFALPFICRNIFVIDTTFYVASRSSVYKVSRGGKNVEELKELSEFKLSDIFKLGDTTLLITTLGRGFLLYNPVKHTYNNYISTNDFVANNIYDAIQDGENFWFATEMGVLKVNIRALLAGKPYVLHLSKQSGLISNEVFHLARLRDQIYAFSDKGFSMIPNDHARFSNRLPRFYLKDVYINDKPVTIGQQNEWASDHNNLKIEYGFISFNNQKIFTRYRLNPGDKWSYSISRSVQFYALAPGDYKYELEYSTDNFNWYPAYAIQSFVILPPVWKRWYFQVGVGVFLLLLIFLYFRNQLILYRRHQQKLIEAEIKTLENERSRIAKDLHDSVGTDFTAIKMMVNQELIKYDAEKTKTIEGQFQHTLQEIKNIIYNLYPPGLERYGLLSAIRNYVDRLKSTLDIEIHLDSFGPEIKDLNVSITVFRILQELITNSVKHSQAKNISLHINSFEDMLSIVYEDNGIGFNTENGSKGFGLYNIESRVQSVHGRMKFETGAFGVSYSIDIPLKRQLA